MTVWPSGLRRWLQAPVRKGVGSNPTAVICTLLEYLHIMRQLASNSSFAGWRPVWFVRLVSCLQSCRAGPTIFLSHTRRLSLCLIFIFVHVCVVSVSFEPHATCDQGQPGSARQAGETGQAPCRPLWLNIWYICICMYRHIYMHMYLVGSQERKRYRNRST